jgi:hypothetical protein
MFRLVGLRSLGHANYPAPRLLIRGRLHPTSYSTACKSSQAAHECLQQEKLLSFEEFVRTRAENFEKFKESPYIKEECQKNPDKAREAYQKFCQSQYSLYKHQYKSSGNPALMI